MTIARTLPLLCLFVLASCSTGRPVRDTSECPFTRDTHERLSGVLWMQTSAEYQALAESTYRRARERIATAAERYRDGKALCPAALEQCGQERLERCDERWFDQTGGGHATPPCTRQPRQELAVVLDLDETVLDNSAMSGELVRQRIGYDKKIWADWVEATSATPIASAVQLVKEARGDGVKVLFVTNRKKKEEAATIENLEKLGITVDEADVYCSEEIDRDTGEPWPSEKEARRKYIASRYWIVALVGDDLGDFLPDVREGTPEKRVEKMKGSLDAFDNYWFLLPNPLYGSWDDVVAKKADDATQLRARRCRIKSFATAEVPACEPPPATTDAQR